MFLYIRFPLADYDASPHFLHEKGNPARLPFSLVKIAACFSRMPRLGRTAIRPAIPLVHPMYANCKASAFIQAQNNLRAFAGFAGILNEHLLGAAGQAGRRTGLAAMIRAKHLHLHARIRIAG